jgi:hypothetical protein
MAANPEPETNHADRLENCCTEAVELLTGGIVVDNLLADLLAIRHDISRQQASEQVEIAKAIVENLK